MKKFFMSLLIIGVMAAVGAGVIVSVWASTLATPQQVIEKRDTTPRVAIQIVEAKRVEDRLYLTGAVEPWEAVTISAEVAGKIEWQGVDDGDAATKGQDLIKINTTSLQARLDQVRAQHTLAIQDFERVQQLRERGISSPQDFDRASTNRDGAAAMVKLAEIELNHSVIHAEFDGVVDRVFNEAGEFVSVGKPLVRLVQVDKLKVLVGVPERAVPSFRPGDAVAVSFDAAPDHAVEGHIYRIATTAESATRTFITEIEVNNRDGILKPGMIARVALVRAAYPDAITVPMFALISRVEGRYVFVEVGGRAVLRPVDVGFYQEGHVLVTKGLAAGDRLIVTGQRSLNDGDEVRVVPEVGAS
jgi:membrane fusion protein (multidrug efflux system)